MKPSGVGDALAILDRLADRQRPFRARELAPLGLPRAWLEFHLVWQFERVTRGVYARRGLTFPRIVVAKLRADRGFGCLFSALWLHGLIPEEPTEAWICIHHKAWKPGAGSSPYTRFVRTSRWPLDEDLCALGPWGVASTGLARTVVDFFRYQRRVGLPAATRAMELVLASGRCTLAEIHACADRYGLRRWRPP